MPVKIIATEMLGRDLEPGDLFSTAPQKYWDIAMNKGSVGEAVFIRSNIPPDEFPDADRPIYRITLSIEHEEAKHD